MSPVSTVELSPGNTVAVCCDVATRGIKIASPHCPGIAAVVGQPAAVGSPDAVGLLGVCGLPGAVGVPVEPGHLVRCDQPAVG